MESLRRLGGGLGGIPQRELQVIEVDGPKNSLTQLCSICHEDLDKKLPESAYLDCMHWFHYECIKAWTTRGKAECPNCKTEANQLFKIKNLESS